MDLEDSTLFTHEVINAAETKPWLQFYQSITPPSIDYPRVSLYERVVQTVQAHAKDPAWDFLIATQNYEDFLADIDKFADTLSAAGFQKGDIMTISMPTSPQGVIPIYAVNKLGGIASMIHPLSPPPQIEMYLNISKSTWALTLDAFYPKFAEILGNTQVKKLILARIPDYLPAIGKLVFKMKSKGQIKKVPADNRVLWMSNMMHGTYPKAPKADVSTDDTAIILYSGGTTGTPKGIELSNMNMISEGMMVASWAEIHEGQSMLAILPIFHGFGLGVCVNTLFMAGGKTILIPTFTPEEVAKLVRKKRPNFLIAVPTLFEALATNETFKHSDLSCFSATFCGADTLPRKTKEKFEAVVKAGGGNCKLLEGYGLTEAVTAIMATPLSEYREGSVGIPFPDMLAQICEVGGTAELPCGEEGEICVSGPAVMRGYLNNPEATEETLKTHDDGRVWLHTGDLGIMDKDGFTYFRLRIKRMLKVSGFNVYPNHVEEIMRKIPEIEDICIIGVPDEKQVTRVKAFVVLKDKAKGSDATMYNDVKEKIFQFGLANLLKYESPREIEFRDTLPKTLIGKIAFNTLEKEEMEKLKAEHKYPFDQE
jgi:long-chain acyl-CoA synthetase